MIDAAVVLAWDFLDELGVYNQKEIYLAVTENSPVRACVCVHFGDEVGWGGAPFTQD